MREELKELLDELPDKEYLDKLTEALDLWTEHKDELPTFEYLDKLTDLPDPSDFDDYPSEAYLDKLIETSQIEPEK